MKFPLIALCCLLLCLFLEACSPKHTQEDIREAAEMSDLLNLQKSFVHEAGRGIRLWCDQDGIYISNDPDFKIYNYDYEGKNTRKLGKKGPAPFENDAIWSFSKDETGQKYWVHDYKKQLIKEFDLAKDSLVSIHKLINQDNIIYINSKRFLVPHPDASNSTYLLSIFDANTNQYIQNYDLLKTANAEKLRGNKYLNFVFGGNFCKNKNLAVYYCYSAPLFFIVNLKNGSISPLWDVRQLPIPMLQVKANGDIQLQPEIFASTSAAMDDRYLYSLTTKDATDIEGKGKFQIDVYDLQNQNFKGSFEIGKLAGDDKPREIAIYDRKMVILFDSGTVNVYKINLYF